MKFSLSLMIDPDLHASAKRYAQERCISFARLVAEALVAVLGAKGELDAEIRARVEERIARHPGRKGAVRHVVPLREVFEGDPPLGDEEL